MLQEADLGKSRAGFATANRENYESIEVSRKWHKLAPFSGSIS